MKKDEKRDKLEAEVKRLRGLLKQALSYLERYDDEGPHLESWKSDPLLDLIDDIKGVKDEEVS